MIKKVEFIILALKNLIVQASANENGLTEQRKGKEVSLTLTKRNNNTNNDNIAHAGNFQYDKRSSFSKLALFYSAMMEGA